ncbi:MAG: hypothetical protein ABR561_02115 [Guyparkeria sp.]
MIHLFDKENHGVRAITCRAGSNPLNVSLTGHLAELDCRFKRR